MPARSEVDAYVTDGVASHIATANARADEVLLALPSILTPTFTDDLTVINESISSYRSTLERYLQSAFDSQHKVQAASVANEEKITALETALTAEQQRLAALVLEYQTQFSTAQDKRASEFSAALTEQQTKYAASAAEQQTQFSKDQDARKSEYVETQVANKERFAAIITEYTQKLKDKDNAFTEKLETAAKAHQTDLEVLQTKYNESAEQILGQIEAHKKAVEKLVGVIGNLGVTSGYQKVANLARWMLFLWQGITVISLAGLIYIAYQMAFPLQTKDISVAIETPQTTTLAAATSKTTENAVRTALPQATIQAPPATSDSVFYQGLATRIFLSLTFGIFAAYAARQASHFLEMERKNRKLALELEALGPYIEPLNKEKQDEFRLKIGDRSFGVQDGNSNKPKTADPVTAYDIFKPKELGEVLANLVKGLREKEK